jgi:3-hydroxybutyryl-CoA dehydrogenase
MKKKFRQLFPKLFGFRASGKKPEAKKEDRRELQSVVVLGAGTMGKQISVQCAGHGYDVTLYDIDRGVLSRVKDGAAGIVDWLGAHGHIQAGQRDSILKRIKVESDCASASSRADLVIECVFEDLEAKFAAFRAVGAHCPEHTIYTTNTSSFTASMLADSCARPARLAAFHFHLPVWTSNVVDLMPHPGTDPTVVETLSRFALSIGQIPITYKREAHGYIFNSMYGAMQRQALDLVIGGVASIEDVDRAWMGIFKMRIGPFGMMDQIGLDTIQKITVHWARALNDPAAEKRAAFLEKLTAQGFCGAKTSRGFYTYPEPAYAQADFLQRGKPLATSH